MTTYRIHGGKKLKGCVKIQGNKNAMLPCIAASLLTGEEIILKNIPDIIDTKVMIEILKEIGVEASFKNNICKIKAKNIKTSIIPIDLATKIRGSILLIAPLLCHLKKIELPFPGGDVIGKRRLDTHFQVFREFGALVETKENIKITVKKIITKSIWLQEASVTATANAIMLAVLASGKTTIINAASEPHIVDLCNMLVLMGASISGIASNRLEIVGVKKLNGTTFTIGPDYLVAGTYAAAAVVTGGDITLKNVNSEEMTTIKNVFIAMGVPWESKKNQIRINCTDKKLKAKSQTTEPIIKISSMPWPGFPSDLLCIIVTMATQIEGKFMFDEKLFEERMFFIKYLNHMGSEIIMCDPHRVITLGKIKLIGTEKCGFILPAPDIRAGSGILLAAIAAKGTSIMSDPYHINRGYEDFIENINKLGGKIKKI